MSIDKIIIMDEKVIHDKIQKAIELICPLYKDNLITDAYIIGSVAKGTVREESDIDILIINPIFEAYLEDLGPDEKLENIKKVVDKLKDIGVQFKLTTKENKLTTKEKEYIFWYQLYKDELLHIMPQRYFIDSLPHIRITKDIC